MFGGGAANPYDEIVGKTTDENLTSENWELILNLCDKVSDEGQEGARNVIASVLKRLAHRNPNVQLYALALTESLSKNCGAVINREIASRAFTQGLEKLVTDRNSHDKVRKRALSMILIWTTEFENDESLGVMEDCYNSLKGKGYKFEAPQEPAPPTVDDEIRRKEEEELQRVLELSMQDKGGRGQWSQYSLAASSSSSSSSQQPAQSSAARPSSATSAKKAPSRTSSLAHRQPPTYQGGYVPARSPSPVAPAPVPARQSPPQQQQHRPAPQPQLQHRQSLSIHKHSAPSTPSYQQQQQRQPTIPTVTPASPTSPAPSNTSVTAATAAAAAAYTNAAIVTRVRALHAFEPTEPGELAFEKGDIIRVVDRGYKDWWRGQLKGRTGIFPVNYVEPMPEPTATELGREAEQEAAVFAQAMNVEKLLNMLRSFDPAKDNLADNEEIQELYRSCMALRPKIVKLIDKYSQKRADLVSMNETFIRARAIFDQMMEESLAKHSAYYEQSYHHQAAYGNSDPRVRIASPGASGPQPYGWNPSLHDQSGYSLYPAHGPAYPAQHDAAAAPYTSGYPAQHDTPAQYPSATPAPAITPLAAATPAGASPYAEPSSYVRTPQGQVHAYSPPGTYQIPAQLSGAGLPYGATPYPAQVAPQPQSVQAQVQVHPQLQAQPQTQTYQQEYQSQAQDYPPQGQIPSQAPQGYHTDYQSYPQQQQQQQPAQVQNNPSLPVQTQLSQQPVQISQHQAVPQTQPQTHTQVLQHQAIPQSQPQAQPQGQGRQLSIDTNMASLAEAQAQQPQGPGPVNQDQSQQAQQTSQGGASSIQPQPQAQAQEQTGPPYVFDPHATYSDPNVQAWAQYYVQGGKDPAGAVYFFSVPGVTDGAAPQPQQQQQQQQQQGQQHHQGRTDSQYEYQEHQAGSTASLGSATSGSGAPVDTATSSAPSSPQQSFQSPHSAEQGQSHAAVTANYAAYPGGGTTTTQAQQYAAQQQLHNRQPLSKASYSSLTSPPGGTMYASSPTGGNAALPLLAAAASVGPGGQSGAPSWVIPKKAVVGPNSRPESPIQQASVPMAVSGGGGGYAPDPAAAPGQQYYTLSNQFAGMSVADQQHHH